MGETPRRSGFRLPWSESSDVSPATSEPADTAADPVPASDATPPGPGTKDAALPGADAGAAAIPPSAPSTESSQFLRELVDAMRGVAESSRDTNLGELRTSLDQRVDELRAAADQRAEELRQRSEQDIAGVGEWERSEIERIRSEAEQRRDARRAKLERELTEHQAAADREVEATRRKLADYERELGTFFAELAEIQDPAEFVAAAKRMPPPPELGAPPTTSPAAVDQTAGAPHDGAAMAPIAAATADDPLAQRLAQLDQRLAGTEATAEAPAPDTSAAPAAEMAAVTAAAQAAVATPTAAAEAPMAEAPMAEATKVEAAADEASTPIVVKGLGSFGAITSFKQALERVDGVRGVTLSLGPTGEFVYRASHGAEFDIIGAIRTIEGQGAGIEEANGSVLVTIERAR